MVRALGASTIGVIISMFGWFFYRSAYLRTRQPSGEAHNVCNHEKDHEVEDCLEGDTEHRLNEGTTDDPILEPKYKIFLSHSGAQKEFVEHLSKALEDCCHYPFYDRRHESLPKGERFPELIVQAAQQCQMLIVVVSNEYFMSKWPMIELNAFVKANKLNHDSKNSNSGPKIFPLFYRLSPSDLGDKAMQKEWFHKWETLAKADPNKQINVNDWQYALDVLRSFNGLQYDAELKEIVAYEDKIVSYVCKSIVADIKWDDSHVQGKSSICKAIYEKIEGIGLSKKYKIKVVGIYGVGGIGKTTMCKTLCNELSSLYEGRVCHIEFESKKSNSKELLQKVLIDLTRKSVEIIQPLNEGECKDILYKSLSKQRTFLAIDNISDKHQSIQQAKIFLEAPYHKDNLVIVTTRSQSVLDLLKIDGDAHLEMPELGEADAVNLFLHHTACRKQFSKENKYDILKCIERCYFSKGDGQGHHYHPLALEALGLQLGCHGENPSEWAKNLPKVRTFNYLSGRNPVFDILRSSFDLLAPSEQTLFMDVGFFVPHHKYFSFMDSDLKEWLCVLYKRDEEEIKFRLDRLKGKGLLQDVDLASGTISMHDLYREFAELEAKGILNEALNLEERRWVYVDNGDLTELESKPRGECWYKLIRLAMYQDDYTMDELIQLHRPLEKHFPTVDQIESLEGIKWYYFSNVMVLQLQGLPWVRGALNLEHLTALRSLQLFDIRKLDRLEGLENLKNLTHFEWLFSSGSGFQDTHIVGQLPVSLKVLNLRIQRLVLGSNLLRQCNNLSKLVLMYVEVGTLDVSSCWSLESVKLCRIQKLQSLLGLATNRASKLQSLVIEFCENLVDIPGIDHLIGLKILSIRQVNVKKVPNLVALTELQVLTLSREQKLVVSAKDCIPHQLQELYYYGIESSQGLNLNGFNQLQVLHLGSSDLISFEGVGDLPALRCLDLSYCRYLLLLPNLSKSMNLEELNLEVCIGLELYEKDIQMLSELPLLQPVLFSGIYENKKFRLDLVQQKVLIHSCKGVNGAPNSWLLWKEDEWKERDLGPPPIKIYKRGTWE